MAGEQKYGNHLRFFPMYHFFAFPIIAIQALVAMRGVFRDPGLGTAWAALVAIALAVAILASRVMVLKVQDRVIRLEERLRLAQVLPAELQPRAEELTLRQLIGLRFASDAELPDLVRKVLDGALKTEKDIKQAVKNWRADHTRA
ncbi:MAG: DUF6526 family protein [Gemmatimonadales bacterium]